MQSKVMLLRNREKENALAKLQERERSCEIVSKVMLLRNCEIENSHQKISVLLSYCRAHNLAFVSHLNCENLPAREGRSAHRTG